MCVCECECYCVRAFVSSKFLYLIQWTVKCAEMLDYCFSPSRRLVLLASSISFPFPPGFPRVSPWLSRLSAIFLPLCAPPHFVCYCWGRGCFPLHLTDVSVAPSAAPTNSNCTPFHEDNALIAPPKESTQKSRAKGTKLGNLLTHKVRKRAEKNRKESKRKSGKRMKEFRESSLGVSWLEDLFGLDGMAMKG